MGAPPGLGKGGKSGLAPPGLGRAGNSGTPPPGLGRGGSPAGFSGADPEPGKGGKLGLASDMRSARSSAIRSSLRSRFLRSISLAMSGAFGIGGKSGFLVGSGGKAGKSFPEAGAAGVGNGGSSCSGPSVLGAGRAGLGAASAVASFFFFPNSRPKKPFSLQIFQLHQPHQMAQEDH